MVPKMIMNFKIFLGQHLALRVIFFKFILIFGVGT